MPSKVELVPSNTDPRENRLARLEEEVKQMAKVLRGNGEVGLRTQVDLCRERLEALQSHWKWMVALLTALAVGVAQTCLKR